MEASQITILRGSRKHDANTRSRTGEKAEGKKRHKFFSEFRNTSGEMIVISKKIYHKKKLGIIEYSGELGNRVGKEERGSFVRSKHGVTGKAHGIGRTRGVKAAIGVVCIRTR